MCTAAGIWAKLRGIVFGATLEDAIHFSNLNDKQFTWRQIEMKAKCLIEVGTPRLQLVAGFLRGECLPLFAAQS